MLPQQFFADSFVRYEISRPLFFFLFLSFMRCFKAARLDKPEPASISTYIAASLRLDHIYLTMVRPQCRYCIAVKPEVWLLCLFDVGTSCIISVTWHIMCYCDMIRIIIAKRKMKNPKLMRDKYLKNIQRIYCFLRFVAQLCANNCFVFRKKIDIFIYSFTYIIQ